MDNQVENLSCLKRHLRRTQISKEKDNYFSQEKKNLNSQENIYLASPKLISTVR